MLIGHEKIIEDLKRLAAKKNLAHGYIFYGPAMVGKRLAALCFANFLETGDFAEPKLLKDALPIAPDAKGTVGIDSIRTIKNFLWQKPNTSAYRTVIIDDAELMTPEAQNALLKVAEEPPHSTLLILVASDIDGLAGTISSRLQKIYFPAVSRKALIDWAKQEFPDTRNLEGLVARSFGKPGLLGAMIRDQKFWGVLESAENLLKLKSGQREFIKKLVEADDFSLPKFMDALIILLSSRDFGAKENVARWHRFLELRREIAHFNLNPRLQLENLFTQD